MTPIQRAGLCLATTLLCVYPVSSWAGDTPAEPPRSSGERETKAPPKWTGCYTDEPREQRGGRLSWRQDIPQAMRDAKRLQRPIMIYFSADW